ncbi:MAG TPA: metal ABC transporter ATP-binding protein [Candidatus Babeliales bacterium]|jgi:manganese/zinc/iron transport system ATP- binding protein|nr:metal ABC transporter ATP-binding protein [Candidatus Babeliales bacterium]
MKNISKIPALEVSHLTVEYEPTSLKLRSSGNQVLVDCSVTVPQGVMCGVIGPNGAGKTTFIKAILNVIPVASGTITILGNAFKDVRNKIAYIPQRSSVDWDFPITVFDMVLMGCYGKLGWFKRPGDLEHMHVYEALAAVGLEKYADVRIGALSGGQQQRAFLARALMQNAQIYFLDEPFAGVDIATEKIIINLFKKLCDEGKTIIVVHHDLFTASTYFDWVILLNKRCIASGPTEQVLTSVYLERTYGNITFFR